MRYRHVMFSQAGVLLIAFGYLMLGWAAGDSDRPKDDLYAQQQDTPKRQSPTKKGSDFILLPDKPGVYISFERVGKRPPPGDDVSDEAVWLRLHNNMRLSVTFCAYSLVDEKGYLLSHEEAGELGLNYAVELTNPSKFSGTKSNLPTGKPTTGFCHVFTLGAGESVVFSVPAEHLVKGLSIKIPFHYEWEGEGGNNPTHFVYFNSSNIPKN
jgi:hypothetical protein